jgi:hypothetical protein
MKKRVLVILAAICLLTSCVVSTPPEVQPTVAPPTAQPTASPRPQIPPRGPDADNLAPLEPYTPGELNKRRYAEFVAELIPRDDYGAIYPFVGVGSDYGGETYGLCTADGTIICDAVYIGFRRFEYEGESVYVLLKAHDRSEYASVEEWLREPRLFIVASDGSFAIEVAEQDIVNGGEGTLTMRADEKWGSIGFNGETIVPPICDEPITFSDGLAAVKEGGATPDKSTSYRYIDHSGDTVLGPFTVPPQGWYSEAPPFVDGLAARCDERGLWGYIDKSGEYVIEPQYVQAYNFRDGRAIVYSERDWASAVIDERGDVIIPFGNREIEQYGGVIITNGALDANDENSPWTMRYYDRDGNFMYETDGTDENWNRLYHGDGWWSSGGVGKTGRDPITLYKDGAEYDMGAADYVSVLAENRFLLRNDSYYPSDDKLTPGTCRVVDLDGNVYYEATDGDVWLTGDDGRLSVYNYNDRLNGVIDMDGNEIIPQKFKILVQCGENYIAVRAGYGGLLDKNGNWLVKISIWDSISD